MPVFLDARIPVLFCIEPLPGDAVLLADAAWAGVHPAACTCCTVRGPAADALNRLFLDRVRGGVPWFTRVVVPADPAGTVRAALDDPVVSARFRAG